jgi:glycerophosphoryl diester phosphodiesterase
LRKPSLPICELDHGALRALDIGRPKPDTAYARSHPQLAPHDGERIPLLGEVIAAVQAVNEEFRLLIEIKTCFSNRTLSAAPETVAGAVIAELRRLRFIDRAILVGFDWAALIHAKRLEPRVVCWMTSWKRRFVSRSAAEASWAAGFGPSKFGGSFPAAIKAAGSDGWFCTDRDATPRTLDEVRSLELALGVWTVMMPGECAALRCSASMASARIIQTS